MKRIAEKTSVKKWHDVLSEAKGHGLASQLSKIASKPRRGRVSVNLDKLDKHVKPSENIIVPGKVLGVGSVTKSFSISAIEYSESAAEKLKAAKCSIVELKEMLGRKGARIIV